MLALTADEAQGGRLQPTTLENWKQTGLPWIGLWLKELIVWGTLDPVVAYLLGRSRAGTRREAGNLARGYFDSHRSLSADDLLNPSTIRNWTDGLSEVTLPEAPKGQEPRLQVSLERQFPKDKPSRWRVLPALSAGRIQWFDPAGFVLASGEIPSGWSATWPVERDFFLDVESREIFSQPYL